MEFLYKKIYLPIALSIGILLYIAYIYYNKPINTMEQYERIDIKRTKADNRYEAIKICQAYNAFLPNIKQLDYLAEHSYIDKTKHYAWNSDWYIKAMQNGKLDTNTTNVMIGLNMLMDLQRLEKLEADSSNQFYVPNIHGFVSKKIGEDEGNVICIRYKQN